MHRIMDIVTEDVKGSFTHLKEFRMFDLETNLISSLEERLKLIEIEDVLQFTGVNKTIAPVINTMIDNYNDSNQYEINYRMTNEEDANDIVDDSFIINVPALNNGLFFYINGRKYYLLLSFATKGHVQAKEKIIFKQFDEMQVLHLDGIPSFNINGKRVNMFSVLSLIYLKNGKTLSALLEDVIPGCEITSKTDSRLKILKHIAFKDFAITIPKYPNKNTKLFLKSLERLKTYTADDFKLEENLERKIKGSYGSPTSKKGGIMLGDLVMFLNNIGTDVIVKNVLINVNNQYTTTQLETEPVFVENIVEGIYKTLKQGRKTYLSSQSRNFEKLHRMFNKPLLRDVVVNSLFKNKLLQYNDSVSNLVPDLKVKLSHGSGALVASSAREVTEDYKNLLALNYSATGKAAGLSSLVAPV